MPKPCGNNVNPSGGKTKMQNQSAAQMPRRKDTICYLKSSLFAFIAQCIFLQLAVWTFLFTYKLAQKFKVV